MSLLRNSWLSVAGFFVFLAAACATPQPATTPIAGLALANVALSTPDPERLRRFYENILGFRLVRRDPGIEVVELTVIERDGVVIALIKVPNQEPLAVPKDPPRHLETPGWRHVVFWVDDLRSVDTHLRQNGVSLLFESRYVDGIGTSITAWRDPDGNLVAFWQRKR